MSTQAENAVDITISEAYFEDKEFRKYICSTLFPGKAEGDTLTAEELESVTEITSPRENITSLQGIEHFPNLEKLIVYFQGLTTLDVRKNTKLTTLDVSGDRLTSINVSKNTELVSLNVSNNPLTGLDVSSNTKLQQLYCAINGLSSLDVSNNTELTLLDCSDNDLSELDLSNNTELETLECSKNRLTKLDLSGHAKLSYLYCSDNQLTSLALSGCTKLSYLDCRNNQLTSLDLTDCSPSFAVSNNGSTICVGADGTIDLSVLPNFEVNKASNWHDQNNVTLDDPVDGVLTVDETVTTVTYSYSCGHSMFLPFTLKLHRHTYDNTSWSSDATSHWHECADTDCPDKEGSVTDKAAHTYDENGKCTECGYQHEHTLTDWKHDETSHWKECTADGCFIADHIVDKAEHTYDSDTDDTCNVCGFKRTLPEPEPKPEPEEPIKGSITLPEDGGVTVTDKDGNKVTAAAKGEELYLSYDLSQLPEDKLFDGWTVTDKDGNAIEVTKDADGKYRFTMPEGDVKIELKTASVNVDPDTPAGPTLAEKVSAGAGGVIAGAAMGAAGYVAGTQIYLTAVLPKGTPIPTSRGALAALLWTTAGKPEPATAALYADVSETEAQKADRWCVEQGLLTDKGESFKPNAYVTRVQVIRSWNALQKLLK